MMTDKPIRVLIVDDTVTYRKIITDVLAGAPGIEVAGTASNGHIAMQRIEQLHPDVMTLDIEMPVMDGLEVLRRLKRTGSNVGAIMLSALTKEGAESTMTALGLGAFDFVLKPTGVSMEQNVAQLRRELCPKIEAYDRARHIRRILRHPAPPRAAPAAPPPADRSIAQRMRQVLRTPLGHPEVVVLGVSTGGPQALTTMLPQLPRDLPVPVLIVQHMPPLFTKSLADDLNKRCSLTVCEAADGQVILPGWVYIAPGGRQMKVRREEGQNYVQITDDPPENSCRPSVDYLFRGASQVYGGKVLGVIMTGMGNDGLLGCKLLKRQGAAILAQDAASCVVYGMPREPIEQGLADVVAPLSQIAAEIARLAGKGVATCR